MDVWVGYLYLSLVSASFLRARANPCRLSRLIASKQVICTRCRAEKIDLESSSWGKKNSFSNVLTGHNTFKEKASKVYTDVNGKTDDLTRISCEL